MEGEEGCGEWRGRRGVVSGGGGVVSGGGGGGHASCMGRRGCGEWRRGGGDMPATKYHSMYTGDHFAIYWREIIGFQNNVHLAAKSNHAKVRAINSTHQLSDRWARQLLGSRLS